MLDAGEVKSRAELARRAGVSAMRVTQILALLKLDPSIKEFIRGLPAGTPERLVTERSLRTVARLERSVQAQTVNRRWVAGLRVELDACPETERVRLSSRWYPGLDGSAQAHSRPRRGPGGTQAAG
jgi:hypothetical protein